MLSTQSVVLRFFPYQELIDIRYFRNMIFLLVSRLYFDVILFNQKILILVSDQRSLILWVLFDTIQSLN